MKNICFASNNTKKLDEIKSALSGKVGIISLAELGCTEELAETGDTLYDNAFQKARYVSATYGVDCFADDTGLEVVALDGAPGVFSGRFGGEPRSDERNVDLLLEKMKGQLDRRASFRTVIALILQGKEYSFEGKVNGVITEERFGEKGFGYDPVFRPHGYFQTFAELSMEEKNQISHRGRAVAKLVQFLLTRDF
ncbi:MAG TPA: RdgB/HAM1 family non-canonical purine NTP pyrophosphatase [Lunatimonas sp.]|nr:RdgB/HAM1 family non-canonical purine NTP pyrophosphatase [Lunatimonas sp.]